MDQPLIVLLGQTAVGKTALSLKLAQELNGEIISADSRLFYRGMDIGTAKPTVTEQAQAPHHLIDLCPPDETITLGEYQRRAYQTIDFVLANGRLPILVGGTGQYVKAVVEGWGIPEVPPQPQLRDALAQLGGPKLARWLRQLDPIAAQKHDPRNVRRIIRALEVTLVTGRPISELQRKTPPPYRICQIGLTRPREELYARIDARVDQMMADGLLAELEKLRDLGYGRSLPSMSGLGYRQLWAYLDGEMSLDEAVERIKFETHRFARHQANWFRQDDPAIRWFDMESGMETAVLNHIKSWLQEGHLGNGKTPK
ncbi:tRNA (adenosine(37)-N6)-dimethylallyltransferase MiaA [Candidatus Leptofilum sp.]|uniref:tRNA (adenosine(37)-N6)-dimethylallyltransferase MiaA n=1 Tax=Candidatus Leptofilum sp. TaxID=3241576 RepID=UPI003B59332C